MTTLDVRLAPAAAPHPGRPGPEQRLAAFVDPGTLRVCDEASDSGMVVGEGRVGQVDVVVFCCDAAVQGGAMGQDGCAAVVAGYDRALALGRPVVGIWHSGGARLAEGTRSLHGVGQVFAAMTRASGRVPQISIVVGPAAGGAAYGPALTDLVIMAPEGRIFVTGPDVVRSATGEVIEAGDLGGAEAHGRRSGVAHVVVGSEGEAYAAGRDLVALLGDQRRIALPKVDDRDLGSFLPPCARRAYDMTPLVDALLDQPGVHLQRGWARNMLTALGRLGGRTVGVVASNPIRVGGCLDATSAEKAARFVRLCDAFGIPLVVLVDVPGYLPGSTQEWGGVVRRGAKLLHAFAAARVPRVTVVLHKAYGGAFIAMNASSLGATRVLAWPTAEVGVMSAVAAVRILHRRQLAEEPPERRSEREAALAAEYESTAGGLGRAIADGVVDEVVAPEHTRRRVAEVIAAAPPGRGSLTNIPL